MSGQGIILEALFAKATTLIDGGWRISFDVDEQQAASIVALASLRGELVKVEVTHG